MANFKGWALTNQGTALLNSLNGLNFTKAMTSISQINLADIPVMATLPNAQQSASKMSKSAVNNQARIAMLFTNENVQTAYSITAVGLYVANQSNVDTLFAVGVLDQPVQMSAITTQASSFGANLLIGINPDQVTVSVNNVGYALQQDLQSLTDSTANSFLAVNNQLKTMPTIIQMNNGDATTLTTAKKYSDDSITTATSSLATQTDVANGDAKTLTSANNAANAAIATAIAPLAKQTDMVAGDAATLANAKGYTDQKIGSVDFSNLATKTGPSQIIKTQTTFSGGAYVVSNGTSISLATSFLNNNKNLNDSDLIEGHYNCYGYSLVNAPVTGSVYATLDVRADGGDNTVQTFTDVAKSLVYVRTKRANVWGAWQQLITSSSNQLVQFNSNGQPTINGKVILTGNVPPAPNISAVQTGGKISVTYSTVADQSAPTISYIVYYVNQKNPTNVWHTTFNGSSGSTVLIDAAKTTSDGPGNYNVYVTATNMYGESQKSNVAVVNIPAIDANVYTLEYDGSATGGLTRADAAVGLVAGVDGAKNDFDNVGPWAKMTKVTDSNGNVFVRIPKTYIRKQVNGNGQNWSVSLVAPVNIPGGQNGQSMVDTASGWYRPTLFWDYTNNVELPYVDVAAYLATSVNNTLVSKSGLMPTGNLNINQFRQQAVANNNGSTKGYSLIDYATVDLLTALFVVEFGTINSQSIMRGYVDTNGQQSSILNNGQSDGIKGSSGSGPRINNSAVMSYRGVENTWGMYLQWIDGVNFNNNVPYLCADSSKYQSDVYANPYKPVGYTGVGGWVSKLGLDTNSPMFQVSVQANGASDGSTYYGDYNWTGSSTLYWGGDLSDGSNAGLFYMLWNSSSSLAGWGVGSRLIKKAL